jgi:hypothetical protein
VSTPRHPLSGQFTPADMSLPSPEAVNAHLAAKPDQPDEAACAVPDVPDHDEAMSTGAALVDLPPGPDAGSKNTGGDDAGYAA